MLKVARDSAAKNTDDRRDVGRLIDAPAPESVIHRDVVITGDIVAPGAIRIDGRLHGELRCGSLTLGQEGVIEGEVVATSIDLAGRVSGAINADDVRLSGTADVDAAISYDTIIIEMGANCQGAIGRRDAAAAQETEDAEAAASGGLRIVGDEEGVA